MQHRSPLQVEPPPTGATAPRQGPGGVAGGGFALLAWRRLRRHRPALFGLVVIATLVAAAVLAPWLAPYNPTYSDFSAFNVAPTASHLMGTDAVGHDILSELLYGGRISLLIGLCAALTTVVVGTLLGAVAGYYGGMVDTLIMRLTDVVLSFPLYLLLFVLSAFLSASQGTQTILTIVLIIGAVNWTYTARLARGEFLTLKQRDYVEAARAIGVSSPGIIVRHLLPNALAPLVVNTTLLVGNAIVLESVLSFFGFGVQPPVASWGSMLATGVQQQTVAPWETIYPGLMILLTVLSINLLGDGLRDALDPFSGGNGRRR